MPSGSATTRIAAPPRSGPVGSQRFRKKRESTTLSRPPSAKIAPPPPLPTSKVSPVELPSTKVRPWMVRWGRSSPQQLSEGRMTWASSQVFM
jgi:hypothetical protein